MGIKYDRDYYDDKTITAAEPLGHARIGFDSFVTETSVSASSAVAGFPDDSLGNAFTYEFWKPSALPATITVDALTPVTADYLGLAVHGLKDCFIRLEHSADGLTYTTAREAVMPSNKSAMFVFDSVTARYWRLTVLGWAETSTLSADFTTQTYTLDDYTDPQNVFLGVLQLGEALQMQRGMYQGIDPSAFTDNNEIRPTVSEGGQWLGRSVIRKGYSDNYEWKNLKARWVRDNMAEFIDHAVTDPFFIAWRPEGYADEVTYGWTSRDIRPTNSGPKDYMSVSFSMDGHGEARGLGFTQTDSTFAEQYTLTRNSEATYYDVAGVLRTAAIDEARFDYDPVTGESLGLLIEEQRTNEIIFSGQPSQSFSDVNGRSQPYVNIGPEGRLSYTRFTSEVIGQSRLVRDVTSLISDNVTYTVTAVFRESSTGIVSIGTRIDSSYPRADFTLSTETFELVGNGIDSASIRKIKNGYLCTATFTLTKGSTNQLFFAGGDGFTTAPGDTFEVDFVQLEQGAFATSYTPSTDSFTSRASTATFYDSAGVLQTAAIDVARDDAYGYLDGVLYPIGLLLEGSSENLLIYSEQFGDASWNKTGATVTADAIVAPDGNMTADKLVEDSSNGQHQVFRTGISPAGDVLSWTVHIKAAERTWARVNFFADSDAIAYVNLSNGTLGTVQTVAGYSVKAQPTTDGWVEVKATRTGVSGVPSSGIAVHVAEDDNVLSYQGDGTSGIYLWGVQMEEQAYATSYIPTAASTVTRSADVSSSSATTREADDCVRTLGSEFNPNGYTAYVEAVMPPTTTDLQTIIALGFGNGGGEQAALLADNGVLRYQTFGEITPLIAIASGETFKAAFAWDGSNTTVTVNGGNTVVNARDQLTSLFTTLGIGRLASSGTLYTNSQIKDFRIEPRALTAAELEDLTGG